MRAQNPDWIPPPPVEEDIPMAKPPALPSKAIVPSDRTINVETLDGKKLHPNVSLIRNKEPVLYTSNLGNNENDEISPISVVVDQDTNGKVKIMISKKYPKMKIASVASIPVQ